MNPPSALTRLALAGMFGLSMAAAAWAQTPPAAPAAATATPAAAPAASGASAPPPPAISVLPKWMQDKLTEARADSKLYEQYYKQGTKVTSFCSNCHGPDGQSALPEVPNLAGQNTIYVLSQLAKFSDGRRKQFFMEGLMRAMSQDEKLAVAIYYTAQPAKSFPVSDAVLWNEGKAIYEKGCKKCHGEKGYGSERNSRIAGQQPVYLQASIQKYRANTNMRSDEKMLKYTKELTDPQIKALVAYIRSIS